MRLGLAIVRLFPVTVCSRKKNGMYMRTQVNVHVVRIHTMLRHVSRILVHHKCGHHNMDLAALVWVNICMYVTPNVHVHSSSCGTFSAHTCIHTYIHAYTHVNEQWGPGQIVNAQSLPQRRAEYNDSASR